MQENNKDRKVVPRWRDFSTTVALGELSNPRIARPKGVEADTSALIAERYNEWKRTGTLWHAADLLNSAFVAGKGNTVSDVANFVLKNSALAPAGLVELASKIIHPEVRSVPEIPSQMGMQQRTNESIHLLRARLHSEPRNAIAWTDLALMYASLGQLEQATRAMRIACGLAPENRFVLRSAGRLFLHVKDPGYALRMIRQASATVRDPWLLAAEVAISSAAGLPSDFAKAARKAAQDENLSAFSKTELYSALATNEMYNGRVRPARQLFRAALESPNENSLAQVHWADHQIGAIEQESPLQSPPRSFEANGLFMSYSERWNEALDEGIDWLRDQPFSTRPAIFSSYLGSTVLERYKLSEEILKISLTANPGDPRLINNLAFALASQGKVHEAQEYVDHVKMEELELSNRITLLATQGLIHMRLGNLERGRTLYEEAKNRASDPGLKKLRALASIYLAREECIAHTPEAGRALDVARQEAQGVESPDVNVVLNRIENAVKEAKKSAS